MAKKQSGGFVPPPEIPESRKCIQIYIPNDTYDRGAFWGALWELTYSYNWQEMIPGQARTMSNLWRDIWNEAYERSNGMNCCDDQQVIKRINPDTGLVEQSVNGGKNWTPEAGGLPSYIVQPVPPVTSGIAGTKCDAATNVAGQVDVWIAQVTNDFDTATTLTEFATAVFEAILLAVVTILTAGTLTAAQALVLPTIGAALTAAWGAGKAVFVAYWTTAIKDKILCAAYCHIGEDGSFTDAQFGAFWSKVNADLPASPAKMLFMGFLSSVGSQGLNAMAATGLAADADCSDCPCVACSPDGWAVGYWYEGTWYPHSGEVSRNSNSITVQSWDRGDGQQVVYIAAINGTEGCNLKWENVTSPPPDPQIKAYNLSPAHADYTTMTRNDLMGACNNVTQYGFQMSPGTWVMKFTFEVDC